MRTTTASFIAACLSALWLSAAAAADFSLTKVADQNTAIPNGTGNFTGFFSESWISGKNVLFGGFDNNFRQVGFYLFDGHALRRVVDKNTPIPHGSGNFIEFGSWGLSGTNVLFEGSGSSGQRGLYLFDGSGLRRVADRSTPIPDGTGTFSYMYAWGRQGIVGRRVAFLGYGSDRCDRCGIYLFDDGILSRIADTTMPDPNGTGNFSGFGVPLVSDDHVVFTDGHGEAIYLFDGGALRRVADHNTPIPDETGNFTGGFFTPMISGGNVLFFHRAPCVLPACDPEADPRLTWPPHQGLYLFDGSTTRRLADNLSTPIPNGRGNFTAVDHNAVISDSHVAFTGFGSAGQVGVYLFDGSTLTPIADTRTPIPNRTASFSWVGQPVVSGNSVAFIGLKGPSCTVVFLPPCVYKPGIYLFDGTATSRIVDTKTAIPGGVGRFRDMGTPAVSGRRVVFVGVGQSGQSGVYLASPSRHNFALVKITAPKLVVQGSGPRPVKVQIQNRGNHGEVISAGSLGNGVTTGLVRLDVSALGVDDDAEKCQPAIVTLDAARNAGRFTGGSATLEPQAALTVHFLVTYSCLAPRVKPGKDPTPGDYRHVASVFHTELGVADGQPADDVCPRDPLPGPIDASTDGTKDQGCGAGKPDGTFGNAILTDVVPSTPR